MSGSSETSWVHVDLLMTSVCTESNLKSASTAYFTIVSSYFIEVSDFDEQACPSLSVPDDVELLDDPDKHSGKGRHVYNVSATSIKYDETILDKVADVLFNLHYVHTLVLRS